jgi:hypothetical protein
VAVGDGPVEQGAGGGDEVFAGVAATAAVASQPAVRGDLVAQGFDVGGAMSVSSRGPQAVAIRFQYAP